MWCFQAESRWRNNTTQQGVNTCHKEVEQTTRNKRVATRPKRRVLIYGHMPSFHYSQTISTVSRTFLVESHFYSTKPWSTDLIQALPFINDWSISSVQRRSATQSLATVIQTDINRTCSRSNQYTSASVSVYEEYLGTPVICTRFGFLDNRVDD